MTPSIYGVFPVLEGLADACANLTAPCLAEAVRKHPVRSMNTLHL